MFLFLRLLNCETETNKKNKQTAESITVDVTVTIEFKKGLHITTQINGHH